MNEKAASGSHEHELSETPEFCPTITAPHGLASSQGRRCQHRAVIVSFDHTTLAISTARVNYLIGACRAPFTDTYTI